MTAREQAELLQVCRARGYGLASRSTFLGILGGFSFPMLNQTAIESNTMQLIHLHITSEHLRASWGIMGMCVSAFEVSS